MSLNCRYNFSNIIHWHDHYRVKGMGFQNVSFLEMKVLSMCITCKIAI